MKKINKININGEIYEIEDNSSGYIPESEANQIIGNIIDGKIEELKDLGFKVEVVETLPVENISHQVIYLVLNGDNEENNIYDEFVYTANNEWEKIGSTKAELSNYYNKQETDEIIANNKVPYYKLSLKTDTSFAGNSFNFNAEDKQQIANIINDAYQNKYQTIAILFNENDATKTMILVSSKNISKQYTSYSFVGNSYLGNDSAYDGMMGGYYKYRISVNGTWVDNVFEVTSATSQRTQLYFLSTTNSNTYNPTQPYHPSTKKYVDDSISTALGDVNSILATLTTIDESKVSE